jgi:hypothetical protein
MSKNTATIRGEGDVIKMNIWEESENYYLNLFEKTGNKLYFDKAQLVKHKIDTFKRMDVYIERAHRLAKQQINGGQP